MPEQHPRLLADRYELRARIGRGTMGTVWRAYDRSLDRQIAVKEIRQDPALSPRQRQELRERMLREGRMAARVTHPSVATIHDVILSDGSPWIIMELVEGRSLEQVIDEEGPLPPRLVAEIGYDLLGALRAAHAQNILHRDVKPANVLLTETGRVVLTDFGIAKALGDSALTQTGMVIGSPGYTAPERARGDHTGPESDLWSLGATLYFAVEGRPAYERATVGETLAALMTEDADPPTQAGPLRPVLEGLLEKDHRARLTPERAAAMLRVIADTPSDASSAAASRPAALPVTADTEDDFPAAADGTAEEAESPGPDASVVRDGDPAEADAQAPAPAPAAGAGEDEDDPNRTMVIIRPKGGLRIPPPTSAAPADGAGPDAAHDADGLDPAPAGTVRPGAGHDQVAAQPGHAPDDAALDRPQTEQGPNDAALDDADSADEADRHSTTVPGRLPGHGPAEAAVPTLVPATDHPVPVAPGSLTPGSLVSGSLTPDVAPVAVPGSKGLGTDLFAMRSPAAPDAGTRVRVLVMMGVALAGLLVVILLAVVALAGGSDSTARSAGVEVQVSLPGLPVAAAASAAGEGLPRHSDPLGFSVGLPAALSLRTSSASAGRVTFASPQDGRYLRVDKPAKPFDDSLAAAKSAAVRAAKSPAYPSYETVRIGGVSPSPYKGADVADWEYTYTSAKGTPLHALSRRIAVPGGRSYVLTWVTPAKRWSAVAKERDAVLASFQPG